MIRKSLTLVATATGAALWSMTDSESPIYSIALPVLQKVMNPESAHRLSINLMKYLIQPKFNSKPDDINRLKVNALGLELENPIGLAAGMDKNAECIEAFFKQGFGYVEAGTITPLPQDGNPKPRYFRLPLNNAVINRYGFNSDGMEVVADRISRIENKSGVLAINIGKNKDTNELEDYPKLIRKLGPLADILVINISSPNTPGLRQLQSEKFLNPLLQKICDTRKDVKKDLPILIKVAPDLSSDEIKSFAKCLTRFPVQGVIVANTTIQRPNTLEMEAEIDQTGGLSGTPLIDISLPIVRKFYQLLPKSMIIVGCGGITNGIDAIKYAEAGATFVQAHTGLGYCGPKFAGKTQREILQEMDKRNVKNWMDLIGKQCTN